MHQPIDDVLPRVRSALADGAFVLVAPPGAGKTTRIPPTIAEATDGAVWVLQPRRVAARSAARRIAAEAGCEPGTWAGWQVRFERTARDDTRVLLVTEGILLRRLQEDPFLEGIAAVILDEFHERSVLADLTLALIRQVREEARPDLIVGVMSATLDPEPVAAFLGTRHVVRSEGRSFPVDVQHLPQDGVPIPDAVAAGVRHAWGSLPGDILAFLPGVREIRAAAARLADLDGDVVPLHGRLPASEQDRALRPGARRRVVLATNVAETSVTVPGVRVVVDAGWVRRPRYDPASGLDRLETVRVSRASATQRAGRAGRTAPGACVRLWSVREHQALDDWDPPELSRVDLAGPVLQLLAWGADPATFGWFEAPPAASIEAARALLARLGAGDSGLTARGHQLAALPVHPRLGALLLSGAEAGVADEAALAAALLSEGGTRSHGGIVHAVHAGAPSPFVARVARQLARSVARGPAVPPADADEALERAVLAGWPDRVARRRAPGSGRARLVGGRGVQLTRAAAAAVPHAPLFVAVDVDDQLPEGLVHAASACREAWLDTEEVDVLAFDEAAGAVRARRVRRYEDLELASQPIEADPVEAATVLEAAARARLADAQPRDPAWATLCARLRFVARRDPAWPTPDEAFLAGLLPALSPGRRSLAELRGADWAAAARDALGWSRWRALDELAPEALSVPSGRRIRLRWDGERPVLAVPMQDLFGLRTTPTVLGGREPVLLHLLAPNGRPQQITDDLAGFWERTWPEVRKELRARYPKHAWPEDPDTAPPGRRRRP